MKISDRSFYYLLVLIACNIVLQNHFLPVILQIILLIGLFCRGFAVYHKTFHRRKSLTISFYGLVGMGLLFSLLHYPGSIISILLAGILPFLLYRRPSHRTAICILMVCFGLLIAAVYQDGQGNFSLWEQVDFFLIWMMFYHIHYPADSRQFLPFIFKNGFRIALFIWIGFFIFSTAFPKLSAELLAYYSRHTFIGFNSGTHIDPGHLGQLSRSDKTIFRVRFPDRLPNPETLYWRGSTLSYTTNGLYWNQAGNIHNFTQQNRIARPLSPGVSQEILLEPQSGYSLFALDKPIRVTSAEHAPLLLPLRQWDDTYQNAIFINRPLLYQATSVINPDDSELLPQEETRYLQVPNPTDGRIVSLVNQLKAGNPEPVVVADRLMAFFHHGFIYKLNPGTLSTRNGLSRFLFTTRTGYCEHFAASFATLMRLSGIPARVVEGFQGGAFNRFDGSLRVRSLDAHAWAEIWVAAQHRWIRYDPTLVVAPSRLYRGASYFQDQEESHWMPWKFFHNWGQPFDALSAEWQYHQSGGRSNLLKDLLPHWHSWLSLTFSVLIAILLGITAFRLKSFRLFPRQHPSELEALYTKYCTYFKPLGIVRHHNEGPLDFQQRCQLFHPDLGPLTHAFTENYITLRYARPPHSPQAIHTLKQLLKQVRAVSSALSNKEKTRS